MSGIEIQVPEYLTQFLNMENSERDSSYIGVSYEYTSAIEYETRFHYSFDQDYSTTELIAIDSNGNGSLDTYWLDTNNSGDFDTIIEDYDEDGKFEYWTYYRDNPNNPHVTYADLDNNLVADYMNLMNGDGILVHYLDRDEDGRFETMDL